MAFISVLFLPFYTVFYLSPSFTRFVAEKTEQNAVRIADHLSSMFVHHDNGKPLGNSSLPTDADAMISEAREDFNLVKIKIFSPLGETIYSTDRDDIGTINRNNYFHNIVAAGGNFTKFVEKQTKSLEGQIYPMDVVETYVPILYNDKFIGAFEIYYDITTELARLDKLISQFYLTLFPIAFCLLMAIFISVYKANENMAERTRAEERLRENEQKYRSLFEHSNDAIIIYDKAGTIIEVNNRATEIFGFSRTAFESMPIGRLPTPNQKQFWEKNFQETINHGNNVFETQFQKFDGVVLDVSISSRVTSVEKGIIQSIIRDITLSKKSKENLRRSYQTQAVLNRLHHLSLEEMPLAEMLELFIYYLTSFPWLDLEPKGAIFLVEERPGMLHLKAQRGLHKSLHTMCNRVPFGKCLCGRSALSGEVVFANSIDKYHDNSYDGIQPHGHYCIPIMSSNKRVMGVFTLYVKHGSSHDQQVEDTLRAVANLVAGVIQRKKAEEELKEAKEDLENRVQERTVELEEMNQQLEQELQERRQTEHALTRSKQETELANEEKDALILDLFEIMYEMLANRDYSTFEHAFRVAEISRRIGLELDLSLEELEILKHGCLVHDIGKVAIPDDVLLKPGLFDGIDRKIMQVHTLVGARLFSKHHHDERIRDIILHHHERLDGSGYPKGISGDEIGLLERIVAVADVYEALVSRRPYKRPLSHKRALDILQLEAKEGKLDRQIVKTLEIVTETWNPLEISCEFRADYTEDLEVFRNMTYFKEPLSDFYNYRYLLYLDDARMLKKKNRETPYHIVLASFVEMKKFNRHQGFIKADQILDDIGQRLHHVSEQYNINGDCQDFNNVMLLRKGSDFIIYSECEDDQVEDILDKIRMQLDEANNDWGLRSKHIHRKFDSSYPTELALNLIFSEME